MNRTVGKRLIQYRWAIGTILWIGLTLLQIHGSAIGMYAHLLQEPELDTALVGYNHLYQLDEWAVFTPLTFSQYYTGFSYFNELSRAAMTDVALVYGQPCWDIITLFRPFLWGYLFLAPAYGLAYYWMGRFIILFLVSYEMGRVITDNQQKWSFAYAVLVAFSPVVQWWFNTNAFVEMLIWGQVGICLLGKYGQTVCRSKRFLYMLGLTYCVVAYSVSLYPAWQVSFGYVFLALAIWVIRSQWNWQYVTRMDGIFLLIGICLVLLPVVHILGKSWPTIQAYASTLYPGQRYSTGGDLSAKIFFWYPLTYFVSYGPFFDFGPTALATFISFSPLGFIAALWQYKHTKQWDAFVVILTVLCTLFICFCMIPWPEGLAKATLLSHVPEARLWIAIDFIQMIILMRVLSRGLPPFNKKVLLVLTFCYVLIISWSVYAVINPLVRYFFIFLIAIISIVTVLLLLHKKRRCVLFMVLISCIAVMTANPIARGTQSVYGTQLARQIEQIAIVDRGKWIVDGEGTWNRDDIYYMNSYPIMFGAPTINSVNFYPDWPRWEKLDLNEGQRQVLNRYAHMNITLVDDSPTDFQNPKDGAIIQDIVNVKLNVHDVKKLEASYILSKQDVSKYSDEAVRFTLVGAADGYGIYHVE